MKALAALVSLAAVAACQADDAEFPIAPGGGGGGGGGTSSSPDAGADAGAGEVTGRVCLVEDLRGDAPCAATGAGGVLVTRGAATAETADDGSFTITVDVTAPVWRVTRADLAPGVVPVGAGDAVLPAVPRAVEEELRLAHGVLPVAGDGAIIGRVRSGGAAAPGATVAVDPPPAYAPLYDGVTAGAWQAGATAARGAFWIPGVPAGEVALTVTPLGGEPLTRPVPVEDQALTFVTVALP